MRIASLFLSILFSLAALSQLGCGTLKNEVDVDALLKAASDDAYLEGEVIGLGKPVVYNDADFVYGFDFTRQNSDVVFSHLVSQFTELSFFKRGSEDALWTVQMNPSEFDIENVLFAGSDDEFVVAPSRQGVVRLYASGTGALVAEYWHGTPLVSAALSPSKNIVALGSSTGHVLLLDAKTLAFVGLEQVHSDEVRGLSFWDEATLLSVSFDSTLKETSLQSGAPQVVKLTSAGLEGGYRSFLVYQKEANALMAVRDTKQPVSVVRTTTVKRLGLEPSTSMAVVSTPAGDQERPEVIFGDLSLRYLSLPGLKVAVCDECVPAGAEMVIGRDVLEVLSFRDNVAADEVWVSLKPPAVTPEAAKPEATKKEAPKPEAAKPESPNAESAKKDAAVAGMIGVESQAPLGAPAAEEKPKVAVKVAEGTRKLETEKSLALPGPGTDLVVRHPKIALTYSHQKAQRSVEVNTMEQEDAWPPANEGSAAALVDAETFTLGRRFVSHRGFTTAVALSPDLQTLASGGWDNRVVVFNAKTGAQVTEYETGWNVRNLRFSDDGRFLGVAAWTHSSRLGNGGTDPAMLVLPVVFQKPVVSSPKQ